MKMSVSLAEEDVEFLDRYSRDHGIGSRSAALARAVKLLRASQLGPAYADAWREWEASGEADMWESTAADGLAS
ncbi:ribbon-helix-helix domain-containing protein [Phytoactinopolyspora mesophila]|uniref:Antitoxin n=1 Tax=Phytoactinopolyspora mesophila TaxID=2650750 RepID=A0A7K3LXJ3_9ACTN|nr:ribbon-helix-helix domain-containing protein [Phytoactinopolyspora mesophila]NDL55741.1 antitoxin [Phytoactinopolyspora mesophila]